MKRTLIFLVFLCVCFFVANMAHAQYCCDSSVPHQYTELPWRVHFWFLEGTRPTESWFPASWKTLEECESKKLDIIKKIQTDGDMLGVYRIIGIRCIVDGIAT